MFVWRVFVVLMLVATSAAFLSGHEAVAYVVTAAILAATV